MSTLSPHLIVADAAGAIAFYVRVLGAVEVQRMPAMDGQRIMHAAVRLGDSMLMLADEFPEYNQENMARSPLKLGGASLTLHVNCPDVDATLARAVEAGGRVTMPATDMFWGDRYGQFIDPYGHIWSVATTLKKLTREEMTAAGKAAFSQGQQQQ